MTTITDILELCYAGDKEWARRIYKILEEKLEQLTLSLKNKQQLSSKIIEQSLSTQGAEGIDVLINAFDPEFNTLNNKEKIVKVKVMLTKLIELGFPIDELLKSGNLSPGYRYGSLISRGLRWITDITKLDVAKANDKKGRKSEFDQTRDAFLRGEIGDINAFKKEMHKKYPEKFNSKLKEF